MNKLLFIRYRKADKVDAGGEQGTNSNYQALSEIVGEENITVFHIHDTAEMDVFRLFDSKNIRKSISQGFSILINFLKGYYFGLSPQKVQEIVELARQHQHVFIDRSVFGIIADALDEAGYPGTIITFFHNVEPVYFKAKISKFKLWKPIVIKCVKKNETQACLFSDFVITLNERDKDEINKRYGRMADILSPVVFKDTYKLTEYPKEITSSPPTCLFLGTYFPMNVQGILWFVKNVLPQTDIKLQIVGKGMSTIVPKVEEYKNIEVFSDVPDLRPFIENADIMLFPIFEGSGMKVKTCEALMYGKNIIGTAEAFEGYELDTSKAGACCNTKKEFLAAIKDFTEHPRPRFNAYSREVFVNNYSADERKKRYEKMFR